MTLNKHNKIINVDNKPLTIEDIVAIADNQCDVKLSDTADFVKAIDAGAALLQQLLEQDGLIYGVTTGYGDSCTVGVPLDLIDELPMHLTRFHGCGLGQHFSHKQARAIMTVRLCSLAKGNSGVSYELLTRIAQLLKQDIAPLIPQEGSVGASGDLTPLSYLSAVLIGERSVSYLDQQRLTSEVFNELNITPYKLKPKEALALMNGTAVMTALACEAFVRTEYLCKLAARITALTTLALKGNAFHFDQDLFAVKPHPGQIKIADWVRADLAQQQTVMNRLQSPYSIRCAPHIIGVVQDSLPWFRTMIENELNISNDNPIIDVANKKVLHGGHFYGGHIATVMDTMKTQIANLADLLDR
ncbi:MAG: aromatic amino acid ammonia-lyase, partial [Gammaproteobacteria bacterium]|nr:aromatic amino acid ammonia-lyase [Gammaproteobacteria bacterium]